MNNLSLRLYVTGKTALSLRAIDNLQRICEADLQGQVDLDVVDVLEQPDLARRANILATPTLVRQRPEPVRKIIGDLSDRSKVLMVLDRHRADAAVRP